MSHKLNAMTVEDKQKLREKIWSDLDDNDLIRTSKSCFGRIPNFKGASKAALQLRNTSEWQDSKTIFSSPDSALREVRENALRDGKVLIMATPKIKEGYILIKPEKGLNRERRASTIEGAFELGEKVIKFPKIDLVVEGSLGVDVQGNRLGKGGGFADREISQLNKESAIGPDTPICSPVHPLQIKNHIPIDDHDEKITMIVTPKTVMMIRY